MARVATRQWRSRDFTCQREIPETAIATLSYDHPNRRHGKLYAAGCQCAYARYRTVAQRLMERHSERGEAKVLRARPRGLVGCRRASAARLNGGTRRQQRASLHLLRENRAAARRFSR